MKMKLRDELKMLVSTRIHEYAMYIALIAIFAIFGILTKGNFLSPRNLSNLINQTGYIAVIAVGMTLVLIVRSIDLSVGYAAGFLGAIAAILMVKMNVPWYVAVLIILAFGIVIGLVQGVIIAFVGVPAFVTTLAFQFIFRGLLSLVTQDSGTIRIDIAPYNAMSNGYVPDIGSFQGLHLLSLLVGAVTIIMIFIFQMRTRRNLKKYDFAVISKPVYAMKLAVIALAVSVFAYVLSRYQGLPWTIVIVAVVVLVYAFMMKNTRLGRYIYCVGGNPDTAILSGINVKKTMLIVFGSMGLLAALGGILFSSRLQSASTTAGQGFELDSIASCYIGGVSTSGGIGQVTNTIVGALVIMSLTNGLNLMGVGIAYQYVIKGMIFIMAVAFDVFNRRRK